MMKSKVGIRVMRTVFLRSDPAENIGTVVAVYRSMLGRVEALSVRFNAGFYQTVDPRDVRRISAVWPRS